MLLSADVIAHCFTDFNQRAAELNSDLCQLALFLDPRYKDIAVPQANPGTLLDKVCDQHVACLLHTGTRLTVNCPDLKCIDASDHYSCNKCVSVAT